MWISVQDQLPTHELDVLVVDSKSLGIEIASYNSEIKQWLYCECCTHVWDITHWMELPGLPNFENKKDE